MTERWERLAREDAEFYIWTDLAPGDDFFGSGERDAGRILDFARRSFGRPGPALEIGCGVGRLTIPMSRAFERVVAVDIAPTMLTKLEANCASRGVDNVRPRLASEAWEHDGPFAFAYSRIVFQHIAAWTTIESYFQRTAAGLDEGGVFYVQFDTRPRNLLYAARNLLPDAVLPRTYRSGVRRIRRTPGDIAALAERTGLSLVAERGRNTLDDEFLFRKASR